MWWPWPNRTPQPGKRQPRSRWWSARRSVRGRRASRSLIQRLARGGERLHEHGTLFGRQPTPHGDHAVFVLIHVQAAILVAVYLLTSLCDPVDPPPAADDALDVVGAAG